MTFIDYLKGVDTPTLSNAIELLKVRPAQEGFTPLQVRSLFPEFGRLCGYAVTAQVESVTRGEPFEIRHFVDLFRTIEKAPKPAIVVMQEIGGYPEYAAHCGEMMASIFGRLGAIGVVSDCGVRDLQEVHALGFHYFARGACASHSNFQIIRSGVPVQIHGMTVRPHDLLHGDLNGLITVPGVEEEAIKTAVEQVRRRERRLMEWVRSERFSVDGFEKFWSSDLSESPD